MRESNHWPTGAGKTSKRASWVTCRIVPEVCDFLRSSSNSEKEGDDIADQDRADIITLSLSPSPSPLFSLFSFAKISCGSPFLFYQHHHLLSHAHARTHANERASERAADRSFYADSENARTLIIPSSSSLFERFFYIYKIDISLSAWPLSVTTARAEPFSSPSLLSKGNCINVALCSSSRPMCDERLTTPKENISGEHIDTRPQNVMS